MSQPSFDPAPRHPPARPAATPASLAAAHPRTTAATPCRHRWHVAAEPQANGYPAACRRCGRTRTFPLADDLYDFNEPLPRWDELPGLGWSSPDPTDALHDHFDVA